MKFIKSATPIRAMLVRVWNSDEYNDNAPNIAYVEITQELFNKVKRVKSIIKNNKDLFYTTGSVNLPDQGCIWFIPVKKEKELGITEYSELEYVKPLSEEEKQELSNMETEAEDYE